MVDGVDLDPAPVTGTISFFDPEFGVTRTAEITDRDVTTATLRNGLTLSDAQIEALLAGFFLNDAATGGISTEPSASGNGTVNWTYSVSNAVVDFLAAGESLLLNFEVTIADGIQTGRQRPDRGLRHQ
ncbi:MAG: VCBS domain-containing protein [Rhizobiaceae bacterium]|nr:VCBS domain-containing protein [Rhizobiaceae bacterium]